MQLSERRYGGFVFPHGESNAFQRIVSEMWLRDGTNASPFVRKANSCLEIVPLPKLRKLLVRLGLSRSRIAYEIVQAAR